MLLLLPLLLVASIASFVSLAPVPAVAAVPTVYVQHETVRVTNPIAAIFDDANHSASASFATGRFEALATTPAADDQFATSAGIETNLTFTNNNPFPFTIWKGMLGAHFSGSYSIVPPGPSIRAGADSNVFLAVTQTGPPVANYSVSLDHAVRTNGVPPEDVNVVTPDASGGATWSLTSSSFTSFSGDLFMPTFTLQPGATMVVAFQLDVIAQRNSTANFVSPGGAQLFFNLPPGITLATNATTPLAWVSVPEPGAAAMLATGVAVLGLFGTGRPRVTRHRGSDEARRSA